MRLSPLRRIAVLLLMLTPTAYSQYSEWAKLVPLESHRTETEKVLGSPEKHFETYGTYETKDGEFSAWYADGKCISDRKGLQYKILPGLLTRLWILPKKSLPISDYEPNFATKLTRTVDTVTRQGRVFFSNQDNSKVFEVYQDGEGREYVFAIWIQPSDGGERFLCPSK